MTNHIRALECQGGIFRQLGAYSTRHSDIWALGIILVNLVCGRNPWKQANTADDAFRSFLRNDDLLLSILPISPETNKILKRVFTLNPQARISIEDLRREVESIRHFTTNDQVYKRLEAIPRAIVGKYSGMDDIHIGAQSGGETEMGRSHSEESRYSHGDESLFLEPDITRVPNLELSSPMLSASSSAASSEFVRTPEVFAADAAGIVPMTEDLVLEMDGLDLDAPAAGPLGKVALAGKKGDATPTTPRIFFKNVLRTLRIAQTPPLAV